MATIHVQAREQHMMRQLRASFLVALCGAAVARPPAIPAEIKVPEGEKLVLQAHATGFQIYTCTAAADQTVKWALKAPEAELRHRSEVIGKHFAGPTWQHKDGSSVTGKAAAHADSPDRNSIPWLLVSATGHSGEGLLAQVSSIQRINTRGGKPPPESECTAAQAGTEARSRYSADYLFYSPK
jgi:hypothetical protein